MVQKMHRFYEINSTRLPRPRSRYDSLRDEVGNREAMENRILKRANEEIGRLQDSIVAEKRAREETEEAMLRRISIYFIILIDWPRPYACLLFFPLLVPFRTRIRSAYRYRSGCLRYDGRRGLEDAGRNRARAA